MSENKDERRQWRHRRGSLFGPLLLIALGIVFLLSNMGALRGNAWEAILQFWPVILIVIGLDSLYKREGMVGAVFLIGLGTVFLLSNLGMINVNVWQLVIRLWPLLLVAVGFDLVIGRRSLWASLAGLVVLLALLAGALWLYGVRIETGQAVSGQEVRQPLGNASRGQITLESGAGDVVVRALDGSADLISGRVATGMGRNVIEEYHVIGDQAIYQLRESGSSVVVGVGVGRRTWELGVTPTIPLDIRFNQGAGASELVLSELKISGLNVSMGVGQTRITLPATGQFNAKIDGAIGQIVIDVPKGMGVRIRSGLALANIQVPSGYVKAENVYSSPEYESAENRVELEIGLAIGNVSVHEVVP